MKILITILLLYYLSSVSTYQNFNEKDDYRMHLSTKTPYSYVANFNDSEIKFTGCNAEKIWMITRHGTRNPGSEVTNKIKNTLSSIRDLILNNINEGLIDEPILSQLKSWKFNANDNESKFLTHEGEEELLLLGERMLNRFPRLLREYYNNSTYKFRFTKTQRTEESAKNFAIGLFGRRESLYVWYPEPLSADPILRFYKLCEKWRVEVDKNPESLREVELFKETALVKSLVENFSQSIGLSEVLPVDDVYLMYIACAFETAWNPKDNPPPWCSILPIELFKAFEFREDLDYYYIDGYGHSINYKPACITFKDMVDHLMNPDDPTAVFYFTHSGTMLKMIAFLGLYKDRKPLYHDDSIVSERKWKTSKIDSFATNLAFIRYSCGDEGDKILTLHQERPVIVPGCPKDSFLCPVNVFLDVFSESLNVCDFDALCSSKTAKTEL